MLSMTAEPMDSLVYLAYSFPPVSSGSNTRNLLLPKYLPRFGWRFNVLTVSNPRGMPLDLELPEKVPEGTLVRKVHHHDPMSILRRLAGKGKEPSTTSPGPTRAGSSFRDCLRSYLLFPDRLITWMPKVVPEGVRLVRETGSSLILSAGPHHSLHLHAWMISRITGIRWVPYFGDLWVYDGYVRFPPGPIRAAHRAMERAVVRNADAIITTTPRSSDYFRDRYGADCPPCFEMVNGYDPETDPPPKPRPEEERKGERFTVTFTGNLVGENTPDYLPLGLDRFFSLHPDAPVRLVMVGRLPTNYAKKLSSVGNGQVVEFRGSVPSMEAREHQRKADLLLTFLEDRPGNEVKNSAKLAEYVSAGKPVLAIAPAGDLTDFVRRMEAGYVSKPDPEAVADVMERILADWRNGSLKGPADPEKAAEILDMRRGISQLAEFLRQVVN